MEFQYQAVDSQGQASSGSVQADGEREAARLLVAQGLTPVELFAADHGRPATGWTLRKKRASAQDKSIAIRELATLLQAGVPLAEAVESMSQSHGDDQIGQTFQHIHGMLRKGEKLSVGLRTAELPWPDFLLQLVTAGEHTGKLAHSLNSAAAQMEYEERVRQEVRSALIYPSILVLSGIAATLLIFVVVVPKFANILKSSRADIPLLSVWVLKAGLFVKLNLLWVGLGFVAILLAIASLMANPRFRAGFFEALSRVPFLGSWLIETEVGRWAAMLSTLLENRVPILKALELAQSTMRLDTVRQKLHKSLREIRDGKKIADALSGAQVLNVTGLNLIRVGERSGELAGMLRTLATLHENAGRERLKRFLILLEPMAILVIGSVIGTIMIAIMLAITSLSNIPL